MSNFNVIYQKDDRDPDPADMPTPDETDFTPENTVPNPDYEQFKDCQTDIRTLAPDLATLFPDDRAVDQALRQLVELGQAAVEQKQIEPAVKQNQTADA